MISDFDGNIVFFVNEIYLLRNEYWKKVLGN